MELSEILESIKNIALYIAIAIYLIFKILKYLLARKKFNLLSTPMLTPIVKTPELPKP